jgi:hypothetical protein
LAVLVFDFEEFSEEVLHGHSHLDAKTWLLFKKGTVKWSVLENGTDRCCFNFPSF